MATVDGITVARAQEIEDASIVSGFVNGSGHLILNTFGGATIDAGDVNALINAHKDDPTGVHGVGTVAGLTEPQTLSSKTLILPTIADFTNAQHDHGSAVDGGGLAIGVANNPAPVTSLIERSLSDADPGPKVMASLTLDPGRWLILATCEGFTLGTDGTRIRVTYNIVTSSPTLVGKPVKASSNITAVDGGRSISGWLENALQATIDFTIQKNTTNASVQATNSTTGQLIAIRMG